MAGRGWAATVVLHFPPTRLRNEPRRVAREIRAALVAGSKRGRIDIRALPAR